MEDENRGGQSTHEVGPIVAAGDMRQFVNEDVIEFGLGNLLEKDLGENDYRVEESRGERGNHFRGDKKLREARSTGVAQALLETEHQIRVGMPRAVAQATEFEVAAHNSR